MNANLCESVRLAAMAISDDETADLSAEQIEAHARTCADCRETIARLQERTFFPPNVARTRHVVDIWPALVERIGRDDQGSPPARASRRSSRRRNRFLVIAVTACLVLAAVGLRIAIISQSNPSSYEAASKHDSPTATPGPYEVPSGAVKQISPEEFRRRYQKYFEEDYQQQQKTTLRDRTDADHWRPSVITVKDGPLGTLFIDDRGKVALAAKYPYAGPFAEGLAVVGTTVGVQHTLGGYGFMDKTGRLIIPGNYDLAANFSDGLAAVKKDGKWGYINQQGRIVISLRYNEWAGAFHDGMARVAPDKNTTQFIDTTGKVLLELDESIWNAGKFSEGLLFANLPGPGAVVRQPGHVGDEAVDEDVGFDQTVGYVDRRFKFVIQMDAELPGGVWFLHGKEFHDGMAAVAIGHQSGTLWGFISRDGRLAIESKFVEVHPFSEGLAAVSPRTESFQKWGFVDRTGEMVIQSQFLQALDFHDGKAAVLVPLDDDTATTRPGESPLGKWGFIDKQGKLIIEPRFYRATSFKNGLARVADNPWSHGYINESGEYVWRLDEPTYGFDKKTVVISQSDQIKLVMKDQRTVAAELLKLGMRFELDDNGGIKHLVEVDGQRINAAHLSHIKTLDTLRSLSITSSSVSDAGLQHLAEMKHLNRLSLSRCDNITNSGLKHLEKLTSLEYLGILYCRQMTDDGLRHLQDLTNLNMLEFTELKITDAGLIHLKKLTKLKRLHISDAPITGSGLRHLDGLKSLEILLLRGCPITDSGLEHLVHLTNLSLLDLTGSSSSFQLKVTDEGIKKLTSALPQLTVNK